MQFTSKVSNIWVCGKDWISLHLRFLIFGFVVKRLDKFELKSSFKFCPLWVTM